MPLRPSSLLPLALGLAALSFAGAPLAAPASAWAMPEIVGVMIDPTLVETSGIAPARGRPGAFWVHNDSGHPPQLHLMSSRGRRLASIAIDGFPNIDWEDLAAFTLGGRRYLLVADTGDNGGLRRTLRLGVFEDPAEVREGMRLEPAWTLAFRWPDGARDCEAVAVDPVAGQVLLISKKRVPPELFAIDLRAPAGEVQTARKIGLLGGIAQPTAADLERNPVYGRYRAQVTSADLSPDGRTLAVLTYQAVYLYERGADGAWNPALERPQRLDFAWVPQAEALTFSADGREIWVAGEQRPSPLIRFRRADP